MATIPPDADTLPPQLRAVLVELRRAAITEANALGRLLGLPPVGHTERDRDRRRGDDAGRDNDCR